MRDLDGRIFLNTLCALRVFKSNEKDGV